MRKTKEIVEFGRPTYLPIFIDDEGNEYIQSSSNLGFYIKFDGKTGHHPSSLSIYLPEEDEPSTTDKK